MKEKLSVAERTYLLRLVDKNYEEDCAKDTLPPLEGHARFPQNNLDFCGWKGKQFVAPSGTVMSEMMKRDDVLQYVNACNKRRQPSSWLYPNPYNDLYRDPANGCTLSIERLKMYLLYVGLSDVQELRAQTPTAAEPPDLAAEATSLESSAAAITLTPPPPPPARKAWLWWLVGLLSAAFLLWRILIPSVSVPPAAPIEEIRDSALVYKAYFWEASGKQIWPHARFRIEQVSADTFEVSADSLFRDNLKYVSKGVGVCSDGILEIKMIQSQEGSLRPRTASILAYFPTMVPAGTKRKKFAGHYQAYSGSAHTITSRPVFFVLEKASDFSALRQEAINELYAFRYSAEWWRKDLRTFR